jgi:hypothetical protein
MAGNDTNPSERALAVVERALRSQQNPGLPKAATSIKLMLGRIAPICQGETSDRTNPRSPDALELAPGQSRFPQLRPKTGHMAALIAATVALWHRLARPPHPAVSSRSHQ